MGWWKAVSGGVIGDPAADYVDSLVEMGLLFTHPSELPGEIRERITALYVEGLGREPTESDLEALLGFCSR